MNKANEIGDKLEKIGAKATKGLTIPILLFGLGLITFPIGIIFWIIGFFIFIGVFFGDD